METYPHENIVANMTTQQILQALNVCKEKDKDYIEHCHKSSQTTESNDSVTHSTIPSSLPGHLTGETLRSPRQSFFDSKDSAIGDSTGSDIRHLGISSPERRRVSQELTSEEKTKFEEKIKILKGEITRLEYERYKLLHALQKNYKGDTTSLQDRLVELEQKNKQLEDRLTAKDLLLDEISRQYDDLKEKHQQSMDRITKFSEDSGKPSSLHEMFSNEPQRIQIQNLEADKEVLERNITDLKTKLNECGSKILNLQQKVGELELELDAKQNENKNLRKNVLTSMKEQEYKDTIQSMQLQMQEYLDSQTRAEQQKNKLKVKVDDVTRKSQIDKGNYEVELTKCNTKIHDLNEQLSNYKRENSSLREKLSQTVPASKPSVVTAGASQVPSHSPQDILKTTAFSRQHTTQSPLERQQQLFKQDFEQQPNQLLTPVKYKTSQSDLSTITNFNLLKAQSAKDGQLICNNCLNIFESRRKLDEHVKKCCVD